MNLPHGLQDEALPGELLQRRLTLRGAIKSLLAHNGIEAEQLFGYAERMGEVAKERHGV